VSRNQKKENNLVILGLKESAKSTSEECESDDLDRVKSIFKEINKADITIKKVKRLKKRTNSTYTDPKTGEMKESTGLIIVELENTGERNSILYEACNLKRSTEFLDVYIKPDLTLAQRDFHRRLAKERYDMNAKLPKDELGNYTGDFYYGIRNNKIVKLFRKQNE
jgi:hypothetical protein